MRLGQANAHALRHRFESPLVADEVPVGAKGARTSIAANDDDLRSCRVKSVFQEVSLASRPARYHINSPGLQEAETARLRTHSFQARRPIVVEHEAKSRRIDLPDYLLLPKADTQGCGFAVLWRVRS